MADDHPDILEMGDQAKTAYDSVDTTRKLAGAGTEAAVEGLSLLKSAARGFFKKVPLIGTAFGIVATAVAMSRAARAGDAARPDDKAPGAEDQRRRELEQWKAEMETDKKVMKAFVVGMTGLMPVPFADKALSAYIDSEEEARKERGDRALHGKKKIDYDSQYLLFRRGEEALSTTFNTIVPTGLTVSVVKKTAVAQEGAAPVRDANATAPSPGPRVTRTL